MMYEQRDDSKLVLFGATLYLAIWLVENLHVMVFSAITKLAAGLVR